MKRPRIFIDRRRRDRRRQPDPCHELPVDLYHRKRRKSAERRAQNRSLAEDYLAFMAAAERQEEEADSAAD